MCERERERKRRERDWDETGKGGRSTGGKMEDAAAVILLGFSLTFSGFFLFCFFFLCVIGVKVSKLVGNEFWVMKKPIIVYQTTT